jgi:glutamate synthase domain-containing protein 3
VNKSFIRNCNMEMVLLDTIDEEEQRELKQLIKKHQELTNSFKDSEPGGK